MAKQTIVEYHQADRQADTQNEIDLNLQAWKEHQDTDEWEPPVAEQGRLHNPMNI